jgi:hypothetical protein
MRAPAIALLAFLATAPVRADEPYDLGVILFDEWPHDLPTPDDGPQIRWVAPKSPAALGGMKPGDIILNIDLFIVTASDLPARWRDKTTGAAGCIPMALLRTELKPKGWHQVSVCIPVKSFAMPDTARADMAGQVPLAVISGEVEKPGPYLLRHGVAPAIQAAEPRDSGVVACVAASGPAPLPPDDCGLVEDPKWKKLPKNRSYAVSVRSQMPEPPKPPAVAAAPKSPPAADVKTAAAAPKASPNDGGGQALHR